MHDIRLIREQPAAFDTMLARRGIASVSSKLLQTDNEWRSKIAALEAAQAQSNRAAKEAGQFKAQGNEAEFERLRALVTREKSTISRLSDEVKNLEQRINAELLVLPNLALEDVPEGADEQDNVEMYKWGTPPVFPFQPKEHFELAGVAGGMDFETASKLSGSRFVVLSGAVARIHRALAQFMLDCHVNENGLIEHNTPILVRSEAMQGTGQLPKFTDDSYETTNGWWLIPTSEVTLTNIVADQIVEESYLPQRYTAHSLCFRSEAGSAGRDTAGMLRQHQFEKVEMVSIVHPDKSRAELDRMTRCAEDILERLGLAYRSVVLCTGDMGFSAQRTHDIEVWLPGQNKYREISSCSLCGDFQARRMNARFRPADGQKPQFVHTLNGSGLAVGRCLIAVLENGQTEDGSVNLPAVLSPYLGGNNTLTPEGNLALL